MQKRPWKLKNYITKFVPSSWSPWKLSLCFDHSLHSQSIIFPTTHHDKNAWLTSSTYTAKMLLRCLWHWNMTHKHPGLITNSRPQLFKGSHCRKLKSILLTVAMAIFSQLWIMSLLYSNFSNGFLSQNKILSMACKCHPQLSSLTTPWTVHSSLVTVVYFSILHSATVPPT